MKKVLQGDIWWINPTPKMGSEQRGRRPALIIQNDVANQYLKTTIVAIISTSGRNDMPEMVKLEKKYGLKDDSYADFAQIFTVDKERLTDKIGVISSKKWNDIEKAMGCIFMKTITDDNSSLEADLEMFLNNPSFDFLKDEPDLYK